MRREVVVHRGALAALDRLNNEERERIFRALERLPADPDLVRSSPNVRVLRHATAVYLLRATHNLRVLFRLAGDQVTLLDIVHRDKLDYIWRLQDHVDQ